MKKLLLVMMFGMSFAYANCSQQRRPAEGSRGNGADSAEIAAAHAQGTVLATLPHKAAQGGEPPRRGSGAPVSLTSSDGTGLRLVSLSARGVVEDPLAFTELRMVFKNPEPRQIEGQFEITLPDGAAISRFAMRQGTIWQEGEVVELQAARQAYEDFLHRRQDPALLEKQAGNQFRARVFPIPPSGEKELIVSYSQERRRASDPYRIHLRGLPRLEELDIRAIIGKAEVRAGGSSLGGRTLSHRTVDVKKSAFTPDVDFEVDVAAPQGAIGLRNENLVVARITPLTERREDPMEGLMVLFDTSASRALGFAAQVERLVELVAALRERSPRLALRVACFDQEVQEIFAGAASDFGPKQAQRILERRPLGASDLARALRWVAAQKNAPSPRVLLFTDGIATAGPVEGSELRKEVERLGGAGVMRLDALTFGGLRDEALLGRLVTAGLRRDGVVLDGELGVAALASRLLSATTSGIKVTVPGSEWVWPSELSGVQPGDQVLVYADLKRGLPFEVQLSGERTSRQAVGLAEVPRPLLERAWVNARIRRLMHQRDTLAASDSDLREALRHQIVDLSTKFRVLSDFTALLVLETEADYARFRIDRRALADILTVGPSGIEVLAREAPAQLARIAQQQAPPPMDAPMRRQAERAKRTMARDDAEGSIGGGSLDGAPAAAAPPEQASASDALALVAPGAPALEEVERKAVESSLPRPAPRREQRAAPASPALGRLALERARTEAPPRVDPYEGKLLSVMDLVRARRGKDALAAAQRWRDEDPGDVLALIGLGEAYELLGQLAMAARAYGSIIDLYPGRADLRRFAGERLDRLDEAGMELAADTYRKARAQRPDHPSSHRLLAYALLRAGKPREAFDIILEGASRTYPDGRFAGVDRILREDAGLIAAALLRREPASRQEVLARLAPLGVAVEGQPSLRFVLNWETDANDVDFHIYDGRGGHAYYSQRDLPSGGSLYADVTTGYGPECFTIPGPARSRAYPYKLQAHYYSRGPMGYGMGKLEIIEHDGQGELRFQQRPFVIMKDGAFVDLGEVRGQFPQSK